ncbi:MAG: hypothetical protein FJW81_01715 [Actinobacteria bacterium]|nr:hypothetical protein [Actinomycetota bacterium]
MTLVAALAIAIACVAVAEPRLLGRAWPDPVLSFGAGIGISYVVLHLLPELARGVGTISDGVGADLPTGEVLVYGLVLVGILGTLALRALQQGRHGLAPHPRIRLLQPALAALIVGYLLAVHDDPEIQPVLVFALAIGLHIALNVHALATKLGSPLGGVALAVAIVAGYGLGSVAEAPAAWVAGITALLAGGVMTRTIHELLDEERHLVALTLGAAAESALLLALF